MYCFLNRETHFVLPVDWVATRHGMQVNTTGQLHWQCGNNLLPQRQNGFRGCKNHYTRQPGQRDQRPACGEKERSEPHCMGYETSPPKVPEGGTKLSFGGFMGPLVLPGKYSAELRVGNQVYNHDFELKADDLADYTAKERATSLSCRWTSTVNWKILLPKWMKLPRSSTRPIVWQILWQMQNLSRH